MPIPKLLSRLLGAFTMGAALALLRVAVADGGELTAPPPAYRAALEQIDEAQLRASIDFPKAVRITRLALSLLYEIADRPLRLRVNRI